MSRTRKSDSGQVLRNAEKLSAARSASERLRLCFLISCQLRGITDRDKRLAKIGKTTQKQKR